MEENKFRIIKLKLTKGLLDTGIEWVEIMKRKIPGIGKKRERILEKYIPDYKNIVTVKLSGNRRYRYYKIPEQILKKLDLPFGEEKEIHFRDGYGIRYQFDKVKQIDRLGPKPFKECPQKCLYLELRRNFKNTDGPLQLIDKDCINQFLDLLDISSFFNEKQFGELYSGKKIKSNSIISPERSFGGYPGIYEIRSIEHVEYILVSVKGANGKIFEAKRMKNSKILYVK